MSIISLCRLGEWVKVFNDTFCIVHPALTYNFCWPHWYLQLFNSISVISCRSVLLFGETGVLGEDYRPVAIHWNKCIIESCIEYILPWAGFKLIGLVVIGTACTCSRNPTTNRSRQQWPIRPYWRTYDMKCLPNRVVWLVVKEYMS